MLAGDLTVYVIRHLRANLRICVERNAVQREPGTCSISEAVNQAIGSQAHTNGNLIRFANQSEFVASFIRDLMQGSAWQCWYYGAFRSLRHLSQSDVLVRVLNDNREHIAQILHLLGQFEVLNKVLEQVDEQTQSSLLLGTSEFPGKLSDDSQRPLFATALRMLQRLNLLTVADQFESIYVKYRGQSAPIESWGDRSAMAQAVLDAVRFLFSAGFVNVEPKVAIRAEQLDSVVAELDWLDKDQLRTRLISILQPHLPSATDSVSTAGDMPNLSERPGRGRADRQGWRPLFAVAWRLAEQMEWCVPAPPDLERIFQQFLGTETIALDWRDRQSLASGVLELLLFLREENYVDFERAEDADIGEQLASSMAELDWLDTDWLLSAVRHMVSSRVDSRHDMTPVPHKPQVDSEEVRDTLVDSDGRQAQPSVRGGSTKATPRQRELLADLLVVVRETKIHLGAGRPDSPANAVRVYVALISRFPQWSDDPLVTQTITSLLSAWSLINKAASQDTLHRLRAGRVGEVIDALPEPLRAIAARTLSDAASLGDLAIEIVQDLQDGSSSAKTAEEPLGNVFHSECAGVFLLVRAMLDARLDAIVNESGLPSPDEGLPTLVLALAMRVAGKQAVVAGQLDPGIALLGDSVIKDVAKLRKRWSECSSTQYQSFQAALLRALHGQRILRSERLHVVRTTLENGSQFLVGGDGANLWPMGKVLNQHERIFNLLRDWADTWESATGQRPAVALDDVLARDVLSTVADTFDVLVVPAEGDVLGTGEAASSGEDGGDVLTQLHTRAASSLRDALQTLDATCLGLPEADLTIALTATVILRLWARWLRQFANSSVAYLLDNFIRRAGNIVVSDDMLIVELESRPLDVVLDMAGYTSDLERIPWLGNRHLRFEIRGG